MSYRLLLHSTISRILYQDLSSFLDPRLIATLAAMVAALCCSRSINITEWSVFKFGRAKYASSRARRFREWLCHPKIDPGFILYPLVEHLLSSAKEGIVIALDTSILFNKFCMTRISLIFLDRAIPLAWHVHKSPSASIAFPAYKGLIEEVAALIPLGTQVMFLADRGFANAALCRYLKSLGWWFRIRIKKDACIITAKGKTVVPGKTDLPKGIPFFWENVSFSSVKGLTFGALEHKNLKESWYVLAYGGEFTKIFSDYARRFCIEEEFLDEKSNGFNFEGTRIRDAKRLNSLLCVISIATILMVELGIETEASEERKSVDTHWGRGLSYFKMGLRKFLQLIHSPELLRKKLRLAPLPFDYEVSPLSVSRKADLERRHRKFKCVVYRICST